MLGSSWRKGHAKGYYKYHEISLQDRCPFCKGLGESGSMHTFGQGSSYNPCHYCNGSGEKKDVSKESLDYYDWSYDWDVQRELKEKGRTGSYPFKDLAQDRKENYGDFMAYVLFIEQGTESEAAKRIKGCDKLDERIRYWLKKAGRI